MEHKVRRLTAAEQVAEYLREGIRAGRWTNKLPGILALAAECDVSPATTRASIRLLEKEGWIHSGGAGRPRRVGLPADGTVAMSRSMRVTILPGMRLVDEDGAFQLLLMRLQHELELAGHECRVAVKSQEELGHNVRRIERFVRDNPADAWVVIGGRHAVVEWFAGQSQPAICIGGAIIGQAIAATSMQSLEVFETVVRHLVELGHRRILFLWPEYMVEGKDGSFSDVLAGALKDAGSEITSYHVPVWKTTPQGLHSTLERSFQFTPPTAIITTYGKWMAGVLSFLAARGLRAPRDISLFSMNEDEWFAWKEPQISCLRGDDMLMVRRIVRWVSAIPRGKADRRHISYPLQWIRGGTIGVPRINK